jgi:hypothetical protein
MKAFTNALRSSMQCADKRDARLRSSSGSLTNRCAQHDNP